MNMKRIVITTLLGMLLGIFCIIGVSQRMPDPVFPNSTIYLIGAWYNRVIMGILIGFSGELVLIKEKSNLLNSILRGAIIGAIVSVGFAFFQQSVDISYFFAGIIFGLINDTVSTKISAKWE